MKGQKDENDAYSNFHAMNTHLIFEADINKTNKEEGDILTFIGQVYTSRSPRLTVSDHKAGAAFSFCVSCVLCTLLAGKLDSG